MSHLLILSPDNTHKTKTSVRIFAQHLRFTGVGRVPLFGTDLLPQQPLPPPVGYHPRMLYGHLARAFPLK